MIDDSVGKVEEGCSQVAEAGKTMDEIVNSVKRVTDIMAIQLSHQRIRLRHNHALRMIAHGNT